MVALVPISLLFSLCTSFVGTFAKSTIFGRSFDYGIFDGNRTGEAFAVFNILLSTFGVIGVMLMQFKLKSNRENWWLAIRIAMYISLWCTLLTFYTLQSVPNTSLGPAGGAQVFNVLLLIGINVLLFLTSDGTNSDDDDDNDDDDDDEEKQKTDKPESNRFETETHLPDGTIERKVEVTNPDGSKTITKTIEKPEEEAGGTEEAGNPWDEGGGGEGQDDDDDDEEEGDFVNAPEESSSGGGDDAGSSSGGSSSSPEAPPPPE